jgi:hypothetical protein
MAEQEKRAGGDVSSSNSSSGSGSGSASSGAIGGSGGMLGVDNEEELRELTLLQLESSAIESITEIGLIKQVREKRMKVERQLCSGPPLYLIY